MEDCSNTYKSYGIPKLITALKDGRSVRIDEVPNGYACGCICPNCKKPLNARNGGDDRQWHFAHIDNKDCKAAAVEAAIHLLAKEVLSECKSLCMPKQWDDDREYYEFEKVNVEESDDFTGYRPDCICFYEGKQMWVEFKNTHAVGSTKTERIRSEKIDCVEIDLKDCEQDKEKIREFLCETTKNRKWIYYDAFEKYKAERDKKNNKVRHNEAQEYRPYFRTSSLASGGDNGRWNPVTASIRMNSVIDNIKKFFDNSKEFYFDYYREEKCSRFGSCEYGDEFRCKRKHDCHIDIKAAKNGGYTVCEKSSEYPNPLVLSNGNHEEDIVISTNNIPGVYERYSKRISLILESLNDLRKFNKPELIDGKNASFAVGFDRKVTLTPMEFGCQVGNGESDLFFSYQ